MRLTVMSNGRMKLRSAVVQVYRSSVSTGAGSVTTALSSTVSTSGSVRAVTLRGV